MTDKHVIIKTNEISEAIPIRVDRNRKPVEEKGRVFLGIILILYIQKIEKTRIL
jgi:hypothetical protein